jgi:N-hydroxyarylamine O-acetyltransferase
MKSKRQMDIPRYLQRIDYRGPREPTAETLRVLQLAHLHAVPFENLSIHWNQPIVLEDAALFEKIVNRRRGGFCYELNGLFGALLRELGFEVSMLSAGVADSGGEFGPDFDHMVLVVTLDEQWLVDVGFGDSFNEPIRLNETTEQVQGRRTYQVRTDGPHRILYQRENGGPWSAQYRFTLEPHQYADYEDMCRYHQTSADSHFTQKRVCTRLAADGRVTLSNQRLIITGASGVKTERSLTDEAECVAILRDEFGIEESPVSKTPEATSFNVHDAI